jgi:hypothetical protein
MSEDQTPLFDDAGNETVQITEDTLQTLESRGWADITVPNVESDCVVYRGNISGVSDDQDKVRFYLNEHGINRLRRGESASYSHRDVEFVHEDYVDALTDGHEEFIADILFKEWKRADELHQSSIEDVLARLGYEIETEPELVETDE